MGDMWERRIFTSLIVIGLAVVGGMLGVQGYGVFLAVAVIVPLAMVLGFLFEARIQDRQRRQLH